MVIIIRFFAAVCLGVAALTCGGCEDPTGIVDDGDKPRETYEQLADGTILVRGDATDAKLDTIDGPVIIEGNIENVTVNTAAAPEE